ncbi:LamG domain-containing protein [Streptomyces sp. NPDC048527]|uniref:LamG domain-containing protein n=1 Tax=Streptomyces sp. NPDC048527 TaxID=3365568 RepID=UPI00370FC930
MGTNDSTGAHNAVAKRVSLTPQGAVFNGTSSSITTSDPVLNTAAGGSFTVAAWVYLTNTKHYATAVSQDGTTNSGFYLQYSSADKRWAFARVVHDTAGSPGIRALSSGAPVTNRWTHLAGVYNAMNGQLSLYVDGTLQRTAKDTTPFFAGGHLAIGRALFSSKQTDWFPGRIKDVEAFDQALTSAQVAALKP